MHLARRTTLAAALTLALSLPAAAQPCLLPGQTPALRVEMFFGRASPDGKREITNAQWTKFLADIVTPRFPAGLTHLDANGQWRDPRGRIHKERSKLIIAVSPETDDLARRVSEIATAWKTRFGQESVGVVTQPVCAMF